MIYELRAYIGKDKTLYTALFTTIEAAKADSEKLLHLFKDSEGSIYGYITPLTATADGRFTPVNAQKERF